VPKHSSKAGASELGSGRKTTMLRRESRTVDLARRRSFFVQHLRNPGEGNQAAVAEQHQKEYLFDWEFREQLDASQKCVVASKEDAEGNSCDVPNYKNHKGWNQRPERTRGVGREG
jgi:hypothetical protein